MCRSPARPAQHDGRARRAGRPRELPERHPPPLRGGGRRPGPGRRPGRGGVAHRGVLRGPGRLALAAAQRTSAGPTRNALQSAAVARIPDDYLDLLERPLIGHLATVSPAGRPQANPMWFLWDGTHLRFTHTNTRRKFAQLKTNPNVA